MLALAVVDGSGHCQAFAPWIIGSWVIASCVDAHKQQSTMGNQPKKTALVGIENIGLIAFGGQ